MNGERYLGELEARIVNLEREIQRIRDWRHSLPNELIIPIQNELEEMKDIIRDAMDHKKRDDGSLKPNSPITIRDFWIAVGSVGITYTVLHVIKLL
jgi:hypothetical protein